MDQASPTREDKARRFIELMASGSGASRATYFRVRRRLEQEGRLTAERVQPMRLIHSRPLPSRPSWRWMRCWRSSQPYKRRNRALSICQLMRSSHS